VEFDGIPIGSFLLMIGGLVGLGLCVSLLIAAFLSEDKQQGILRQLWHTFFSAGPSEAQTPHNDNAEKD
jgi:hypothetical protein